MLPILLHQGELADEFIFKTNIESFLFSKVEMKPLEREVKGGAFIMLKQGNYLYKVGYHEIIFIETSDHATTVYTLKGKYTSYTSLKSFEEMLTGFDFERANRNTLVNMDAVKRINVKENFIEIEMQQIQISRSNKQIFIDKYLHKIF